MHVRHLASDPGPGHAEIDLHAARRPLEPHVPLAIRHAAVRLAPPVHVTHRGRILAVVVRLRQQTVVHAPDRVPLLPGQQTIGLQPLVHQMRVRVDLRPVPAIRLRLGRAILHIRVLRDRPAIHVKTPRYLRARHSLPVESPDILHNGHRYRHVPFLPERRPAATGRIKTDWQLGNIQAAAPMPITSPGNDDDTGENHQPTLRKNTAEPVEQTLKQNNRQMARGRRAARTTRRNRGHGHSRPTQPRMRQGRASACPPAPSAAGSTKASSRPTRTACKPQSARAPAARTRGTAMRHIDLRFCEGIVSHFFGVIGSPQCKSLKTLEFEACRASIVSESCLETPKNRV